MKKKTRRTRRQQPVNLLKVGESALLANAITTGMFGTNLAEFLTGRVDGKFNPAADGYATITLPELAGFSKSGFSLARIGGNYGGKAFMEGVKYNLARNGTQMASTLILAPIAFRVFGKLSAAPRRSANRLLDMTGLKTVVKV